MVFLGLCIDHYSCNRIVYGNWYSSISTMVITAFGKKIIWMCWEHYDASVDFSNVEMGFENVCRRYVLKI